MKHLTLYSIKISLLLLCIPIYSFATLTDINFTNIEGTFDTQQVDRTLNNGTWSSYTKGADASASILDGEITLYQQWGIHAPNDIAKYAKLKFTYNDNSPNKPWRVSTNLKWLPNLPETDHGSAIQAFSLYNIDENSTDPLFSIWMTGSLTATESSYCTTIHWKTPTESGSHLLQKLTLTKDDFTDFKIEYDPTSGFVLLKIGDAKIHQGNTNKNIHFNQILISNEVEFGFPEAPGKLQIADVTVELTNPHPVILHGIANGDFNKGYFGDVTNGTWTTLANLAPSAKVEWDNLVDDESNGFIKLINNWFPHTARISYVDDSKTAKDSPWIISVDLKGEYTRHYRNDIFYLADALGNTIFSLNIKGSTTSSYSSYHSSITWIAGTLSGSVSDIVEISTNFFQKLEIEYNPISGQAIGRIANKVIFDVFTTKDLQVKEVGVENNTNSSTWDPGILYVDNFKSQLSTDLSNTIILHNIEKGDFNNLSAEGTGTVTNGWWQGASTSTGNVNWDSQSKVSVEGADNHIELWQNWENHWASITYNDYNTTPTYQSWKVAADLKRTFSSGSRKDKMQFQNIDGNTIFEIAFSKNCMQWNYFDEDDFSTIQSEVFNNSNLSGENFENIALSYNPLTGEIIVYRNGATIFSTIVNIRINISKISFSNNTTTWDPGTFYIDNVKAYPIQNRNIIFRGIATKSLDFDVLERIKQKYGANQIRYYISPFYEARNRYYSSWVNNDYDPEKLNSFQYWHQEISKLSENLKGARKLGLSVIINVHQTPALLVRKDSYDNEGNLVISLLQDEIWDTNEASENFKLCWREITDRTQHLNQNIWLELFNEPNVNGNNTDVEQKEWNELAQQTIDQIRGQNLPSGFDNYNNQFVDRIHPIVFAPGPGAIDKGFRFAPLMKDHYLPIIYTIHSWEFANYTHHVKDTNGNFSLTRPTKNDLRGYLNIAKTFQSFYDVRILVGEFGALHLVPERTQWIKENIDIFEEYGWDWQYWAWDSPFSVEKEYLGEFPDPNDPVGPYIDKYFDAQSDSDYTEVGMILKSIFELN